MINGQKNWTSGGQCWRRNQKGYNCYRYGYTAPVISFNRKSHYKIATVGLPIPAVEVKIAGDGEVLTRGPLVVPQQEIQQRRIGPEILGDKDSGGGVARDEARSKGATDRAQELESRVLVAQAGQTRTGGVVPRNPFTSTSTVVDRFRLPKSTSLEKPPGAGWPLTVGVSLKKTVT